MTLTTRELRVERATQEGVAPFGYLIDIDDDDESLPTAFYEGTVRVVSPSNFATDEDTDLTMASIDRRELCVQWMQRHFKHTQTFIPLGGRLIIVVMAPPGEDDLPDVDQVSSTRISFRRVRWLRNARWDLA